MWPYNEFMQYKFNYQLQYVNIPNQTYLLLWWCYLRFAFIQRQNIFILRYVSTFSEWEIARITAHVSAIIFPDFYFYSISMWLNSQYRHHTSHYLQLQIRLIVSDIWFIVSHAVKLLKNPTVLAFHHSHFYSEDHLSCPTKYPPQKIYQMGVVIHQMGVLSKKYIINYVKDHFYNWPRFWHFLNFNSSVCQF